MRRPLSAKLPERAFGVLMRLYPRRFRRRYGRDMTEHFRDVWLATAPRNRPFLVGRLVLDGLRAAGRQRLTPHQRPKLNHFPPGETVSELLSDVRFALRTLRRNPLFSSIAIITIALGIGANTAIFSLVNAAMLRPMPYAEPDRLVAMWLVNSAARVEREDTALADLLDWQDQSELFESMGAYGPMGFTIIGESGAESIPALLVSPGLFDTLGVSALIGRTLNAEDAEPGRDPVVVLSYGLWRRRFGADAQITDRRIELDGHPHRVAGVMPASFRIPQDEVGEVGIYAPLTYERDTLSRYQRWMHSVGRLRPGASVEQAQAEMKRIAADIARTHPTSNAGWSVAIRSLHAEILGPSRLALILLQSAVGFVLLISCVNVANLLLGRVQVRSREIAVRTALGAGRWRLLRQLVTESTVLALIGGGVGLLIAYGGVGALRVLVPEDVIAFGELVIDTPILVFALLLSLATGLLFGVAPGWQASRVDPGQLLQSTGGRFSSRHRFRSALVVAEIALALILLVGAALLIRSFGQLLGVNLGFRTDNVLTFSVAPNVASEQRAQFFSEVITGLERLPSVESASAVTILPLEGSNWTTGFDLPDDESMPEQAEPMAQYHSVMPRYFDTIGARITAGRDFDSSDVRGEIGSVIINQAMARRFWRDQDPLGKTIGVGMRFSGNDPRRYRIIGIASDISDTSPAEPVRPALFVPYTQQTSFHYVFVVRTAVPPLEVVDDARAVVAGIDAGTPMDEITTLDEVLAAAISDRRFNTIIMGAFAGLALLLATVGLYGVMATMVIERRREIGIRMALGAHSTRVVRSIVKQSLLLTAIGVGIGVIASQALIGLIASLLYAVSPADPVVLVGAPLVLAAVALLASYLPARRATRIEPSAALRIE